MYFSTWDPKLNGEGAIFTSKGEKNNYSIKYNKCKLEKEILKSKKNFLQK